MCAPGFLDPLHLERHLVAVAARALIVQRLRRRPHVQEIGPGSDLGRPAECGDLFIELRDLCAEALDDGSAFLRQLGLARHSLPALALRVVADLLDQASPLAGKALVLFAEGELGRPDRPRRDVAKAHQFELRVLGNGWARQPQRHDACSRKGDGSSAAHQLGLGTMISDDRRGRLSAVDGFLGVGCGWASSGEAGLSGLPSADGAGLSDLPSSGLSTTSTDWLIISSSSKVTLFSACCFFSRSILFSTICTARSPFAVRSRPWRSRPPGS